MKQRIAVLKLFGNDTKYGLQKIPADFLKAKGVPDGAKILRRIPDVADGVQCFAVVIEHPSFAEVELGARIPDLKPKLVEVEK
jgi:hypothetical protein